jgi:acyl carrier protein
METDAEVERVGEVIRRYIVEGLLLGDDSGFDGQESLLDAGILDSTGVMEVVDFLEETFEIAIEPQDLSLENLDSVERLTRFVLRKQRTSS